MRNNLNVLGSVKLSQHRSLWWPFIKTVINFWGLEKQAISWPKDWPTYEIHFHENSCTIKLVNFYSLSELWHLVRTATAIINRRWINAKRDWNLRCHLAHFRHKPINCCSVYKVSDLCRSLWKAVVTWLFHWACN